MLGIAFGTRPEWIKILPVVKELIERVIPFKLIITGQHSDLLNYNKISEDLFDRGYDPADWKKGKRTMRVLEIATLDDANRLDSIVSSILSKSDNILDGCTSIMVQGDTTSAFACALAAFHRQIPVIHLEAGLRTYVLEQPFPEEGNRQMISCIAKLHLCPTYEAEENLYSERKDWQSLVKTTGNTVLDNIRDVKTTNLKRVLVTMHRRENHERLDEWFTNINALAKERPDYEFLLPIHPNPNVLKHRDLLTHVKVVEPMEHDELIKYLASCEYVITDSGGIQEEACFLRKPTIVCRKDTEREEGLGNFSMLCTGPEFLSDIHGRLHKLKCEGPCPYGDGHSVEKVVDAIQGL